jgi:hypothetical protein
MVIEQSTELSDLELSEALYLAGKVILHYQLNRKNERDKNDWKVGLFAPIDENQNHAIMRQERSYPLWKVSSKKVGAEILDNLEHNGFIRNADQNTQDEFMIHSGRFYIYLLKPGESI